jgi:hypothetical protein
MAFPQGRCSLVVSVEKEIIEWGRIISIKAHRRGSEIF